MKRMPILTSGHAAVEQGLIDAQAHDAGSDWAALVVIDVSDRDASLLGEYFEKAHRAFLATGDTSLLTPFQHTTINGLPLITDPRLIEEFDEEFGQIDVAEIYDSGQ